MKNEVPPGWRRALWRHAAVSQVEAFILSGKTLAKAISVASQICFADSSGIMRKASPRSLRRWHKMFKRDGIALLLDKPRTREAKGLSTEFLTFLTQEKEIDPDASIPEVIARAKECAIIDNVAAVDRTTVYRAARRLNLPILRRRRAEATSMRPFAFEHRMMMVLCDGKHFRAGAQGLKRVALIFIDDATRYILGVGVGPSETQELFLKCLYRVLRQYGRMGALFLDNGGAFRADDVRQVLASLKIPLIYGTPAYPEGHAKVERFNSTITQAVLRGLKKPDIDSTCAALETRLAHYVRERYNPSHNEGVSAAPGQIFQSDTRSLEFFESDAELRRAFVLSEQRKVRRDNIISCHSTAYETPLGYAGRRITIYRDVLENRVSMLHDGKLITLSPPDLAANARAQRPASIRGKEPTGLITTAAELHFNRDYGPIVDADGGFQLNQKEQEESRT